MLRKIQSLAALALLTFCGCSEIALIHDFGGWQTTAIAPGLDLLQLGEHIHVLKAYGREAGVVSADGSCSTIPDLGISVNAIAGVNWSFAGPWPRQDAEVCEPFALVKENGEVLHMGEHIYQHQIAKTTAMTIGFSADRYYLQELEPEDTWPTVEDAAAGWPTLLPEDPGNYPQTAPFLELRAPRTAAGLTAEGDLLLVVVDGRKKDVFEGMTLGELTYLLRNLGAVTAVNADGGGSSTMWVRGEVVNQPSDGRPRAVSNGVFVF